jgi:hypothetical protein
MELVDALVLAALAAGAIGAIYAAYRAVQYVRVHGLFYDREGRGGGGSAFMPLQEFVEPQIQHVEQVKEQRRASQDDESGSGSDDPR